MSKSLNEQLMKNQDFVIQLSQILFNRSRETVDALNENERTECMPFPGPAMAGINTAQWGVTTENYKAEENGISFDIVAHNYQKPHQFNVANGKLVGEIGNMAAVRFAIDRNSRVYPNKRDGKLVWWTRDGKLVFRKSRKYSDWGHERYHDVVLDIIKKTFLGVKR